MLELVLSVDPRSRLSMALHILYELLCLSEQTLVGDEDLYSIAFLGGGVFVKVVHNPVIFIHSPAGSNVSTREAHPANSVVDAAFLPLDIPISSCCFVSPRSFDQMFSLDIAEYGIMWPGGNSTSSRPASHSASTPSHARA